MIDNKYINDEVKDATNMINEFATLTKQLGIKTIDDVDKTVRWNSLKVQLEKRGLIEFE
jgi:hypothetical protein